MAQLTNAGARMSPSLPVTGTDKSVALSRGIAQRLLAEARREPGIECCGLLAGRDGVISTVLPARNALQSAAAFEIQPAELFSLFRAMRSGQLEHLGIYHSHPRGDNSPSPTDIERAYYPAVLYFILSPVREAVQPIRCFRIVSGQASELGLQWV
jgi:proteasome lid subunit RPN8/RPN11